MQPPQEQLIPAACHELVWRGATLGVMRGDVFSPERFTEEELQRLVGLIADLLSPRRREIMRIVEFVCNDCKVAVGRVVSYEKRYDTKEARYLSIALVSDLLPAVPDDEIAHMFKRDRSLVSYARGWIKDTRDTDTKFSVRYDRLRRELQNKLFETTKAA